MPGSSKITITSSTDAVAVCNELFAPTDFLASQIGLPVGSMKGVGPLSQVSDVNGSLTCELVPAAKYAYFTLYVGIGPTSVFKHITASGYRVSAGNVSAYVAKADFASNISPHVTALTDTLATVAAHLQFAPFSPNT